MDGRRCHPSRGAVAAAVVHASSQQMMAGKRLARSAVPVAAVRLPRAPAPKRRGAVDGRLAAAKGLLVECSRHLAAHRLAHGALRRSRRVKAKQRTQAGRCVQSRCREWCPDLDTHDEEKGASPAFIEDAQVRFDLCLPLLFVFVFTHSHHPIPFCRHYRRLGHASATCEGRITIRMWYASVLRWSSRRKQGAHSACHLFGCFAW